MSIKPEIIRGDELVLDLFIEALKTHVPAAAHLTFDGTELPKHELLDKAVGLRSPFKTKRTLKTELKKAQMELDAKRLEIRHFVKSAHTCIKAFLGEESPDIAKFGFKPDKKQRPLTSAENQARAKKAEETRLLNHTMGPAEKKRFDKAHESGGTPPAGGAGASDSAGAGGPTHVA
ncbi:hypothetical protein HY251_15125 [bacterium]|nr:hypothetical protein [bacterium]